MVIIYSFSLNSKYLNTVTLATLVLNFNCISSLASCNDEIQNQGEDEIDCGGPCDDCQTTEGTET